MGLYNNQLNSVCAGGCRAELAECSASFAKYRYLHLLRFTVTIMYKNVQVKCRMCKLSTAANKI